MIKLQTIAAAAILVSLSTSSHAFGRLVAFGDSLSDMGNVYALTNYPPPPYWQGRFSNGRIWLEHVADANNLTFNASLLGGTNHAWGGAELDTTSDVSHAGTPNIGAQINGFALGGGTLTTEDLVSVWGGGNDFLAGATNPTLVASYVTTHLNSLYALGGRKFLVPNLPMLGYVPRNLGTANEAPANMASLAFNAALAVNLASFRSAHSDVIVFELNVQALSENVRANPGLLGLTNVTQSYLAAGSGNPDQYMFWDDIHPTRVMHRYLGDQATALVPEPASMLTLAAGLGRLLKRRRKSPNHQE